MGALATRTQVERVSESVAELCKSQKIVYGDMEKFEVHGANKNAGAFFSPILFETMILLIKQQFMILRHLVRFQPLCHIKTWMMRLPFLN